MPTWFSTFGSASSRSRPPKCRRQQRRKPPSSPRAKDAAKPFRFLRMGPRHDPAATRHRASHRTDYRASDSRRECLDTQSMMISRTCGGGATLPRPSARLASAGVRCLFHRLWCGNERYYAPPGRGRGGVGLAVTPGLLYAPLRYGIGSTGADALRISKWTCGVSTSPVRPDLAMTWPRLISSPLFTSNCLAFA